MSKWVQHRSGDGEKWEVIGQGGRTKDYELEWSVKKGEHCYNLPKSEYIECSPPEEWEDVTVECDWGNAGEGMEAIIFHQGLRLLADRGYRLRKIKDMYNISYFIVERRKS